eukprot:357056-Chlamydomonas_euryale.AAC.3
MLAKPQVVVCYAGVARRSSSAATAAQRIGAPAGRREDCIHGESDPSGLGSAGTCGLGDKVLGLRGSWGCGIWGWRRGGRVLGATWHEG